MSHSEISKFFILQLHRDLFKYSSSTSTGSNDCRPFLKYLLKIILRAHQELAERIELVEENLLAYEIIKK